MVYLLYVQVFVVLWVILKKDKVMISKKIFLLISLAIVSHSYQAKDDQKEPSRFHKWEQKHKERKAAHARRKAQEEKKEADLESDDHTWRKAHKKRKAAHAQKRAQEETRKAQEYRKK